MSGTSHLQEKVRLDDLMLTTSVLFAGMGPIGFPSIYGSDRREPLVLSWDPPKVPEPRTEEKKKAIKARRKKKNRRKAKRGF